MRYQIENGTVSLGGKTVLDHIDFSVKGREKIAVVGRNGAGKTTLLRLISGELSLDRDDKNFGKGIKTERELSIGFLHQQSFQDVEKTVEQEIISLINEEDIFSRERYYFEKEYDRIFTGFGFQKEDVYEKMQQLNKMYQSRAQQMRDQNRGQLKQMRKQQQEELAELLADVPEHCQVLLLGEKIDKRGKLYKSLLKTAAMVECKSLKSYQLKPWLDEQAALRGCRFDYEASQTIMEYLSVTDNAPLLLLEQEIEKLSVYAGERKIWTKDDIEQTFAALPEVSRFALLNAIAEKKLGQTLELLGEERKHGNTVLALCGLVSFQLRRLGRVKELLEGRASQAEIASELKAAPFAVKKMAEQSRRFGLGELERALLELSQLNIEIRYGGRQFEKLEEILIRLLSK